MLPSNSFHFAPPRRMGTVVGWIVTYLVANSFVVVGYLAGWKTEGESLELWHVVLIVAIWTLLFSWPIRNALFPPGLDVTDDAITLTRRGAVATSIAWSERPSTLLRRVESTRIKGVSHLELVVTAGEKSIEIDALQPGWSEARINEAAAVVARIAGEHGLALERVETPVTL